MKNRDKKHKVDSKTENSKKSDVKHRLHPRNKHRNRYDLELLVKTNIDLGNFIAENKYGDESIDFANPKAVLALNKALLKQYYNIDFWDIPEGYLCPSIPGRADYIHHIADLLAKGNFGKVPEGKKFHCIDIGTGANCVYPIIGVSEYGWSFTGTEIDPISVESATKIVNSNPKLADRVNIVLQSNYHDILIGIIKDNEKIDLTVCNPPFHASKEEAETAAKRKIKNLNLKIGAKPILNFGGQNNELWCKGGELKFVLDMIIQSKKIGSSCFWFSTLISKYTNLKKVYNALKKANVETVQTLPMGQGNKSSRVVAWTFLNSEQQKFWAKKRW